VTCGPLAPGPARTSSVAPGATLSCPPRSTTLICRKASPDTSASCTNPTPFSLRLMSPEQREEEAGRILLRIAALGIPLISIDGEAIDISDIEAKAAAEAEPTATPKKP